MKPLTFTLYGNPATKKNSMRIIDVNGRGGKKFKKLLPSKAFEDYEADCLRQITGDRRLDIDSPVNVKCLYYMQTRRRVDLVNLLEATDDILVASGVLEDDRCDIVHSHDGSRVYWDKRNPRVEITITDAEESYTQWDSKRKAGRK